MKKDVIRLSVKWMMEAVITWPADVEPNSVGFASKKYLTYIIYLRLDVSYIWKLILPFITYIYRYILG